MHPPPKTRHSGRATTRARLPGHKPAPRSAKQPSSPEPAVEEEVETVVSLGRPWNVIVWDDPVNLMSYVVYVFQKLFGFTQEVATRHMMEVHNEGKSLVASADREKAEFYVSRLHGYGLQATLEQAQDD